MTFISLMTHFFPDGVKWVCISPLLSVFNLFVSAYIVGIYSKLVQLFIVNSSRNLY